MRRIVDIKALEAYVEKYQLNQMFSIDMRPHMELFLVSKNDYICKADEPLEYLFFFVEGKAKVYNSLSNGKSLLICFYNPLTIIGDVEFLQLETANSNIQVINESYCIGISFKAIRQHVLNDAKFLRHALGSVGEKLLSLSKYSSINLLYTLENRLASYILACSSSSVSNESNTIVFEGNLTEVAELLGTSYRHLLRTLQALCSQKAIKKSNNYYEILDIGKLAALAGDLYD